MMAITKIHQMGKQVNDMSLNKILLDKRDNKELPAIDLKLVYCIISHLRIVYRRGWLWAKSHFLKKKTSPINCKDTSGNQI